MVHDDEIVALRRHFSVERLGKDQAPALGSLGRRFVGLADALEAVLGRTFDPISDKPLVNPHFRRAVDASRRVLYERASAQAPP